MEVHTDFTSDEHTLVFTDGKRVHLTKKESIEFEKWFNDKAGKQQ